MMEQKCINCGYYGPDDYKCYYFVDQQIDFDEKPPKPMYAQPDDDGCEVWIPKEEKQRDGL